MYVIVVWYVYVYVYIVVLWHFFIVVVFFFFFLYVFFFQAEDGIRDLVRSRGLGDVYKRQPWSSFHTTLPRELTPLPHLASNRYPSLSLPAFDAHS